MKWLEELTQATYAGLRDREREVLWSRGVSDAQIELFRIGRIDKDLPEGNYPSDFLTWWGDNAWQFDDCFVLPLTNTLGHVRGIQLRHVELHRKGYMDFIADKEEAVLFGLGQAMPHVWSTKKIWLVEGAFDLCPLQRHVPNIVSTLHAGIQRNFYRVLRRMVNTLYLAYDMDAKGRDASYEIAKEHRGDFDQIKIVSFPRVPFRGDKKTKDPQELWEAWGDNRLGVYVRDVA